MARRSALRVSRPHWGAQNTTSPVGGGGGGGRLLRRDDDDDDDDDGFLLSFIDDDALIVLYKLSRVLFLEELAMDGRADGRSKRESIPKPLSNVKTTTTDALAMLCAMRED